MRHMSFTLSRPGLKPGHYVPLRLRMVDTLTILSGVPAAVTIVVSALVALRWADQIGFAVIWRNRLAFYAYSIVVAGIAGWTVSLGMLGVLKFAFCLAGMMTREEAKWFPLQAGKGRVDPWPESWQVPCESSP